MNRRPSAEPPALLQAGPETTLSGVAKSLGVPNSDFGERAERAVIIGRPFEPEPGHAGGGKRRARARRLPRGGRDEMSGTSKITHVDQLRLADITTGPLPA